VDCKAVDSLISCLKDCRRPAFPGETGGIDPPPGAKSAEHTGRTPALEVTGRDPPSAP